MSKTRIIITNQHKSILINARIMLHPMDNFKIKDDTFVVTSVEDITTDGIPRIKVIQMT